MLSAWFRAGRRSVSRQRTRPRLVSLESRITPALNDNFVDAELLGGPYDARVTGNYQFDPVTFDITPFTGEVGEPDHGGAADPVESAWFRWTAPASLATTIVVLDLSFGATLVTAVYTGSAVDALTEVAGDVAEFGTTVRFDAVAGTTYSIAVDSAGPGIFDFNLILSSFTRPANDDFADAFVLDGSMVPAAVGTGTSTASTAEPGEPNHGEGLEYFGFPLTFPESTWFSWTAPTTGLVKLRVETDIELDGTIISGTISGMAIYTGDAVDQLTLMTNSFGITGGLSVNEQFFYSGEELTFSSVAGTTYRIAVSGDSLFPETYRLELANYAVPGSVAIGDTVYVVGSTGSDNINISPAGAAADGSTGVTVKGSFSGPPTAKTLTGSFTGIEVFAGAGNNVVTVADSINRRVAADFGGGNDFYQGGNGPTFLIGGAGNNTIRTGIGADEVYTGSGRDDIRTSGGDDFVRPDDGNNRVNTGDGDDAVFMLPDVLSEVPFSGANLIDLGPGRDFAEIVSSGTTDLRGGAGDDFLGAGPGRAVITAGDGNDQISAGDGNSTVNGGNGDDFISVGRGNNFVDAGSGNDVVSAGRFFDLGDGVNVIQAGSGDDSVRVSSNGSSVVFAGTGDDDVTIGYTPPSFKGAPGAGRGFVFGEGGNDILLGGPGADVISGDGGNDLIAGGSGSDVLLGGGGSDLLFDGTARATGPDTLRQVLNDWNPLSPASYVDVRARLTVTFDLASRDYLFGGGGLDWFWSDDPLDVLDRVGGEARN